MAGRFVYVTRKEGFSSLPSGEGAQLVSGDKVEINLNELLYAKNNDLNIEIKPFDIISVAKAEVVYVLGSVRKAGGFVLEDQDTMTVLQALAMAEGLDRTASKKSTRIIRTTTNGTRMEIPIDLGKILKGNEQDPVLIANDILYIPDSTQKLALKRALDATIGTISGVLIYSSR